MAGILSNLRNTVIAGFVLTVVMIVIVVGATGEGMPGDTAWITFMWRWLHVLSAVMWIGLLWYFNFVQIPNMPNIPDDQKPAIGKVIAPAALWWFRWAAMATIVTGLMLAFGNGYLVEAMTLGLAGGVVILDDLTSWVSRLLLGAGNLETPDARERAEAAVRPPLERLVAALHQTNATVIVVTNEVGAGVAPPTRLGNIYADLLGEVNAAVAALSSRAYLMTSGFSTRLR